MLYFIVLYYRMSLAVAQNSWISSSGVLPPPPTVGPLPYIQSFKSSVPTTAYSPFLADPEPTLVGNPITFPQIADFDIYYQLEFTVNIQNTSNLITPVLFAIRETATFNSIGGFETSLPPVNGTVQVYKCFADISIPKGDGLGTRVFQPIIRYNGTPPTGATASVGDYCYTLIAYSP